MANEKNEKNAKNEEVIEKVEENKIDKETGELLYNESDDFSVDIFAANRGEERQEVAHEGETVVYPTGCYIFRDLYRHTDERDYYNYAFGYNIEVNGRKLPQKIFLEPSRKVGDTYDLINAIFGEDIKCELEIVRRSMTTTQNGISRTSYTYSPRVSTKDDHGNVLSCGLVPTRGNTDKFNNLVNIFKGKGIVK